MSDSKLAGQFFDAAIGLLGRVRDEESGSIAAAGTARAALQNDKSGQIVAFTAEAVSDPRTHAGPTELARAGVHEQFGRRMVEKIRRAGPDEGDVIDDGGGPGGARDRGARACVLTAPHR